MRIDFSSSAWLHVRSKESYPRRETVDSLEIDLLPPGFLQARARLWPCLDFRAMLMMFVCVCVCMYGPPACYAVPFPSCTAPRWLQQCPLSRGENVSSSPHGTMHELWSNSLPTSTHECYGNTSCSGLRAEIFQCPSPQTKQKTAKALALEI